MITFDAPLWLFLAPVTGLAVGLAAWWAGRARRRKAALWSKELVAATNASPLTSPVVLGFIAVLISIGIATPRFGSSVVVAEAEALDLVIAADISRSMLAEDVAPSRLGRTRREAVRLIQDLAGDRLGLLGFAGQSFILSPLTIDDGALRLLVDALDPSLASAGGTAFGPMLRQARQLLTAGEGVADRVLVVFTDGEVLDSLATVLDEARLLRRDGVRLVLVGQGDGTPTRIPIRDPDGGLIGYQRDIDDTVIETSLRQDILEQIADAAGGSVVSPRLTDQAGAVRNLVEEFKRAPTATTSASQNIPRGWILALLAAILLMMHALTRKTAALAAVALFIGSTSAVAQEGLPNPADAAWREGDLERARGIYRQQVLSNVAGDTAWFNLGTAALALEDTTLASDALSRAAESADPDVRFRALYNLGLMWLRLARQDSARSVEYLDLARQAYREALLLDPTDADAKWNYELTNVPPPPENSDGSGQAPPPPENEEESEDRPPNPGELSRDQAEQILNSLLEEERQTREDVNRRRGRSRRVRRKDW